MAPDIIERWKASAQHQLCLPLLPFTHARSESINADSLKLDQTSYSLQKGVVLTISIVTTLLSAICFYRVQSRFAETRFAETLTLTLTLNPNFGESGFGESGRHLLQSI